MLFYNCSKLKTGGGRQQVWPESILVSCEVHYTQTIYKACTAAKWEKSSIYRSGFIIKWQSNERSDWFKQRALWEFNIQSSFTVQNPRAPLVKIDHVIFFYLSSANSDSAVLTIMHKNRALLKMSSTSRLVEVEEKYIPQIINDPIPNKTEEDNNLKRFHVQR